MESIPRSAYEAATAKFPNLKLKESHVGIELIDLASGKRAGFNENAAMYPASVVKLFFLACAADALERKRIPETAEFVRGVRDMIVESSNDATGYVLDSICGTTPGPELPAKELKEWMAKRQTVNQWFAARGYQDVVACQRTYNEGPYGREKQGYGPGMALKNSLTPFACARLMAEIMRDPRRGEWMKSLLERKPKADGGTDFQATAFIGKILPKGSNLWSKAGYVYNFRHDVAAFRLPDGRRFVFAIFTDVEDAPDLVPYLAAQMLLAVGAIPEPYDSQTA